MHFLELPEELILTVISWLPLSGIMTMRLVNREVNRVCCDSSLWRGRFIMLTSVPSSDSLFESTRSDDQQEEEAQQQEQDEDGDEEDNSDGEQNNNDVDMQDGEMNRNTTDITNNNNFEEREVRLEDFKDVSSPPPSPGKVVYPSERLWCSSVVDGNRMYIYGGHTTRGASNLIHAVKADMYSYDFASKTWTELPHEISGKTEHKCVVYNDALWFVGGYNGQNYTNDLRRFEPTTGVSSLVLTTGTPFSPRSALTAVVHKNKMYTFGGWNGFSKQWFNDLHSFNFDTKEWCEIHAKGERPCQRTSHACVVWNNRMYVFAGFSGEQYLNDVHEFDFETETWRNITMETTGTRPSPRSRFCAVVHGNSMYLLGGWNKVNYFGDFFAYNFVTKTWTQIISPHFDIPSLSQYSVSVYNNKLYIFGGFCAIAKECINRLYVYQLPEEETTSSNDETRKLSEQHRQDMLVPMQYTYITSE